VDALGQSVLRIHNIQTQILDTNTGFGWSPSGEESISWNLTTQQQIRLINCTDRALVASGGLVTADDNFSVLQLRSEAADINPTVFTHGYLIATESLYLGAQTGGTVGTEADVCIMMECTVEKLTKEAALALALSQQ